MKANPGGQIPTADVVGRDRLVERLWRILARQSLVLRAERRMGKTCVLKKMVSDPRSEELLLYRDLEGIRSPTEFVREVFNDVERHLSAKRKVAERARSLLGQLAGAEVAGAVKFPTIAERHWKEILNRTIEDLMEQTDGRVVFLWDELPLMLYNIKGSAGEEAAMEVLDALRALRQMHSDIRMVYTGSIGLHNVISALKGDRYPNDPTNDMDTVDVPPLGDIEATELALRLLQGEGLRSTDPTVAAAAIAAATDNVPYFIHHVVDQMVMDAEQIGPEGADEIVNRWIRDPDDRWHLGHYRARIDIYYEPQDRLLALHLLDIVAQQSEGLPFEHLFDRIKAQVVTEDREAVLRTLGLLLRDHYLAVDDLGIYTFRLSLVRRFWRCSRGLG